MGRSVRSAQGGGQYHFTRSTQCGLAFVPEWSYSSRPMAEIVLGHLSKSYAGGGVAVDDVSLRIGDGEFMVLGGPSGCGKSTLLRLAAGLAEASQGTVPLRRPAATA